MDKKFEVPKKPDFIDNDTIRLVNIAFAYCFKEARLATTVASDLNYNEHVAKVSTIMRVFMSKDEDLLSYFDKIEGTQA